MITIVELAPSLRDVHPTGYGRTLEEAQAHAGITDEAASAAVVREVEVRDAPGPEATWSAVAAEEVCRWHIAEDEELPASVRSQLATLMEQRLYASAIEFCFQQVWDRGFELELPPAERHYLP